MEEKACKKLAKWSSKFPFRGGILQFCTAAAFVCHFKRCTKKPFFYNPPPGSVQTACNDDKHTCIPVCKINSTCSYYF